MKRAIPAAFDSARRIGIHLGHELVWLVIAVLFCLVEAIVLVTELRPLRFLSARIAPPANPMPSPPAAV